MKAITDILRFSVGFYCIAHALLLTYTDIRTPDLRAIAVVALLALGVGAFGSFWRVRP